MIGDLRAAFDFLLHVLSTSPLGLWAVVAGLLGAMGTTWALRRWVILRWLFGALSKDARRAITQTVAFVAGVLWTWAFWPDTGGILIGILVGLLAPVFWAVITWALCARWPALRDALRGDPDDDAPAPPPGVTRERRAVIGALSLFLLATALFAWWAGDARGAGVPKKGTADEPTYLLLTPDGRVHPVCAIDFGIGQGTQLAEAVSCTVLFRSGFETTFDEINARMKRARGQR